MIVSELIKEFEKLPQDMMVLGRGYESGYNEIENINTFNLLKCRSEWWDGDYQHVDGMMSANSNPLDTPKEYICLT